MRLIATPVLFLFEGRFLSSPPAADSDDGKRLRRDGGSRLASRGVTPSVSLRSTDLRRFACLLPAQRAASSTPSKREPFRALYDSLLFHSQE